MKTSLPLPKNILLAYLANRIQKVWGCVYLSLNLVLNTQKPAWPTVALKRSMSTTKFNKWKSLRFMLRSEEHTSELQSRPHLVCRLLLEKKKDIQDVQSHVIV